jgi:hypothetical protein
MVNKVIEKLIVLNGYQANYVFVVGDKYSDSIILNIVPAAKGSDYRFIIDLSDGKKVRVDATNVIVVTN